MKGKFRVLIPAAGKSSRSGLPYPKTLYRLNGVPILIKIFQTLEEYDKNPILIINPAHEPLFKKVTEEFGKQADFIFQHVPRGMGNAVLQAGDKIDDDINIILVWSDIPFINKNTIDNLIKCHLVSMNNFSLVTSLGSDCYTIVERENGKLIRVKETRELGIDPAKEGERDIGLFIFKKYPAFTILEKDDKIYEHSLKEHGFLYIIERLAELHQKLEGYPIALPGDILSFNTPEDLKKIEKGIELYMQKQ